MWQKAKNVYHLFQAILANILYGFPARSMTVVGITGTDGKTTTTNLIYHILKTSAQKVAMISTISAVINGREFDTGFHVSTPNSFALQSYLKKAKEADCSYVVLEVTSHGLDQNRVWGIPFSVGVLTNITQEHLDYHKTFTNYVKAKAKLLTSSRKVILNRDDASYNKVLPYLHKKSITTYGMKMNADINPLTFPFGTKLIGDYNRYNCLATIAACQALNINDEGIRKGIESFTLPKGRLAVVYQNAFTIIVDFAHTPNSIEQVLKAVKKEMLKDGRIIHIFGAAGERDRAKRSVMGKMSARYADLIILTAEDPRSESAERIIEDIAKGIPQTLPLEKIPDRMKAIRRGVELARKDDIVIVTGKGHEQSMNFGAGEVKWSDTEAVEKALKQADNDQK